MRKRLFYISSRIFASCRFFFFFNSHYKDLRLFIFGKLFLAGLNIHTFHGNFFVRSTDLLSLANVNPDSGYAVNLSIEESLSDYSAASIQAALLYTTSKVGHAKLSHSSACSYINFSVRCSQLLPAPNGKLWKNSNYKALVCLTILRSGSSQRYKMALTVVERLKLLPRR